MQDIDPIADLRAALAAAKALNFSQSRLFRLRFLPVGPSTMYRWLNGDVEPGAVRLGQTVRALKEFTARERRRMATGARTAGGEMVLDEEFFTVKRGGVVVRLKQQEFKLLEALRTARKPAYFDWLVDVTGVSAKSLPRAASMLRRRLPELDFEMITVSGRGGEPAAYVLSNIGCSTGAAA